LDANRRLAVAVARSRFTLPYHFAAMRADGGTPLSPFTFSWHRKSAPEFGGEFRHVTHGAPHVAIAGSLEFFLLERYVLFAHRDGRLASGRVHHMPYPTQDAEVLQWDAGILGLNGFAVPTCSPDHAVASPGVEVSVFPLEWAS
jgi:uncharacterized protein YqjF (DUF2071 family)